MNSLNSSLVNAVGVGLGRSFVLNIGSGTLVFATELCINKFDKPALAGVALPLVRTSIEKVRSSVCV